MANPLVDIFRVKELRDRILFTIGILVIYRLGTILPVPGINIAALKLHFAAQGTSGALGIEDFLDFFAGGAFKNFSIFMLTIMPYISMSIIMQLLTIVFPKLKKIQEEDGGKKKISRWTRYGTVVVALDPVLHGHRVRQQHPGRDRDRRGSRSRCWPCCPSPRGPCSSCGWETRSPGGASATGSRMIIFAGIVARIPGALWTLVAQIQQRTLNPVFVLLVLALWVVVIGLVIMEQQGQRKIPVHYAKRVIGRQDVRRAEHLPSVQGQPLGGHPGDLRLLDPPVPRADRAEPRGEDRVAVAVRGVAAAERPGLRHRLRAADHLLRVLLHAGDA